MESQPRVASVPVKDLPLWEQLLLEELANSLGVNALVMATSKPGHDITEHREECKGEEDSCRQGSCPFSLKIW